MSSYDAPDFVVSIYNPSFFASDTASGITTAQARALFLKKATPDTATALTTFSGGINVTAGGTSSNTVASDTYNTASTSAVTNLFTNKTSGIINVGSGNGTIKIGNATTGSGRIELGTSSTACPVYSNSKLFANIIEGVSNDGLFANGPLNLGTLSTTTVVQLGTSSSVSTITIGSNIATVTSQVYNAILGYAYTTLPTYTLQTLGGKSQKINGGTGTTSATPGTVTQIGSFNLEIGIYMFEASMLINTANVTAFEWYVTNTTGTLDAARACGGLTTTANVTTRMSGTITNSINASTWYVNAKSTIASTTITTLNFYVTRIA